MNSRDSNVPTQSVDPHGVLTQEDLVQKLEAQTKPKITPAIRDSLIVKEDFILHPGTLLTICVLTLKNGFTVTGESACADPGNFKEDIGRTIARRNAADKIWSLAGYELKTKLALIDEARPTTLHGLMLFGESEYTDPKTYVGTKVVHAMPMTRGDYNNLRGWKLPENENVMDEGYIVEYADGGAPNVPAFDGYISWSPKDVFERAYMLGVPAEQDNFLTRLKRETAEVKGRHEKLNSFIGKPAWFGLDQDQRDDLMAQSMAMNQYITILERRLAKAQASASEREVPSASDAAKN